MPKAFDMNLTSILRRFVDHPGVFSHSGDGNMTNTMRRVRMLSTRIKAVEALLEQGMASVEVTPDDMRDQVKALLDCWPEETVETAAPTNNDDGLDKFYGYGYIGYWFPSFAEPIDDIIVPKVLLVPILEWFTSNAFPVVVRHYIPERSTRVRLLFEKAHLGVFKLFYDDLRSKLDTKVL